MGPAYARTHANRAKFSLERFPNPFDIKQDIEIIKRRLNACHVRSELDNYVKHGDIANHVDPDAFKRIREIAVLCCTEPYDSSEAAPPTNSRMYDKRDIATLGNAEGCLHTMTAHALRACEDFGSRKPRGQATKAAAVLHNVRLALEARLQSVPLSTNASLGRGNLLTQSRKLDSLSSTFLP